MKSRKAKASKTPVAAIKRVKVILPAKAKKGHAASPAAPAKTKFRSMGGRKIGLEAITEVLRLSDAGLPLDREAEDELTKLNKLTKLRVQPV